ACDPPLAYVARIRPEHVWLNLEYLSAETWVDDCHALPSPQPGGVLKTFFFPGFSPASGGLLREASLLSTRDAFQADAAGRAAFLQSTGVDAGLARAAVQGDVRVVSLFCYRDAPVEALTSGLSGAETPSLLLVSEGSASGLASGRYGACSVVRVPFLVQDDYDRLLWSADLNFVRGEDSFVRAQWAGRPVVWHIYPQTDGAHVGKLEAWLARYRPPPAARDLHLAWNAGIGPRRVGAQVVAALAPDPWQAWRDQASGWSHTLAQLPELADAIAEFCKKRIKSRV